MGQPARATARLKVPGFPGGLDPRQLGVEGRPVVLGGDRLPYRLDRKRGFSPTFSSRH